MRRNRVYAERNIPLDPVMIPDETECPHLTPGSEQFILLQAVEAVLPRLSGADQKVIRLRIAGFTFREISQLLGIPIPTAKSQYQAAARRLRKEMGE
jgi:DNA-directed RNA polymerase specialized sigma24 family protein